MTEKPTKTVDIDGNVTYRDFKGEYHREDGPAIIGTNGDKHWLLHGKFHREDGPAADWADGVKHWYLHGELHREDGPAVEYGNGYKEWFLHGKYHREDGPAIEWADGGKEWYLLGVKVDGEKYELILTCPLEELPEYIGTEYECVAKKRLGK